MDRLIENIFSKEALLIGSFWFHTIYFMYPIFVMVLLNAMTHDMIACNI